MFTRIQTASFRCLRGIDQEIGRFCALVGPNASGKTTFLDVIGLLHDLMDKRGDVVETVQAQSTSFEKLLWMGHGHSFQLGLEADIPLSVQELTAEENRRFKRVRYEVEIGLETSSNEIGLNHETLWLTERSKKSECTQRELFPSPNISLPPIVTRSGKGKKMALTKKAGGNDNYYPEGRKSSYKPSFKTGRRQSALANVPADRESFPVSTWFRGILATGVQSLVLNSQIIRQPSPPGLGRQFHPTGANLPWVSAELRDDKRRFDAWLQHVRTALEDIQDIHTVVRPEDRHSYLVIKYSNGAEVPSWLASDGTLRLLALTVPAYIEDLEGVFLIEEPENGVHPRAMETVLQSLSSMYSSQVLIATHSPVALNMLEPSELLCFAKDADGATDIVSGDRHPVLRDWKQGEPDLGTLFASGILS